MVHEFIDLPKRKGPKAETGAMFVGSPDRAEAERAVLERRRPRVTSPVPLAAPAVVQVVVQAAPPARVAEVPAFVPVVLDPIPMPVDSPKIELAPRTGALPRRAGDPVPPPPQRPRIVPAEVGTVIRRPTVAAAPAPKRSGWWPLGGK